MNINEFQASIHSRGVLQNNRFVANFELPTTIRNNAQRYGQDARLVQYRCEAAQIPGVSLTTLDQPRLGIGPLEMMPHNVVMDDVSLTFLVDAASSLHALFFDWFNTIVNFQGSRGQSSLNREYNLAQRSIGRAFEVGYKDDYKTDIIISVYTSSSKIDNQLQGADGALPTGIEVMRIKLFNAFPKTMPAVDLSWAANDELVRLTVPFSYTDYYVYYPRAGTSFTPRVPNPISADPADISLDDTARQYRESGAYDEPPFDEYAILPDRY
jgi:hypothetical protein